MAMKVIVVMSFLESGWRVSLDSLPMEKLINYCYNQAKVVKRRLKAPKYWPSG